jgi:hypothetical protein
MLDMLMIRPVSDNEKPIDKYTLQAEKKGVFIAISMVAGVPEVGKLTDKMTPKKTSVTQINIDQ